MHQAAVAPSPYVKKKKKFFILLSPTFQRISQSQANRKQAKCYFPP